MCSMPGDLYLPHVTFYLQLPKEVPYTCSQLVQTNIHTPCLSWGSESQSPFGTWYRWIPRFTACWLPQCTWKMCTLLSLVTCSLPVLSAIGSGMLSGPPHTCTGGWASCRSPYGLAQLLTVLAEIHDAGTPHRKEPAGHAEPGPSGPWWGPVRLTCPPVSK